MSGYYSIASRKWVSAAEIAAAEKAAANPTTEPTAAELRIADYEARADAAAAAGDYDEARRLLDEMRRRPS